VAELFPASTLKTLKDNGVSVFHNIQKIIPSNVNGMHNLTNLAGAASAFNRPFTEGWNLTSP